MQGLGVIQRKSWLHESHDVLDHITFYNAFAEFEILGNPPSIPAHSVYKEVQIVYRLFLVNCYLKVRFGSI